MIGFGRTREQHSADFTSYLQQQELSDLWRVVFRGRSFGDFKTREMARLCIRSLKTSLLSRLEPS